MGLATLGLTPDHQGKVREIVDLGERLLFIATDRLSAFDHVLPTGIPQRGVLLSRISAFWFRGFADVVPTHFVSDTLEELPPELRRHEAVLAGRSLIVRKAQRVPVECVVRGWLTGSGYQSYRDTGEICGVALPSGLRNFDRLPEPIFTPTTKADQGHDAPLTYPEMVDLVGADLSEQLRRTSLEIFRRGTTYAERRGIVIADTKFEFGWIDGRLALIDEVLTPDSSRFWPLDSVGQGGSPVSLDKQFVRDYLISIAWDREGPAPPLPDEVVARTGERYREAAERLMGGRARPDWDA
jgi:phosphoribosylaminoimidazole-succinocarboxamide synthase